RQLCEDLLHGRVSRSLALRARHAVRPRHAVPAARPDRSVARRRALTMRAALVETLGTDFSSRIRRMREGAVRRTPPPLERHILYLENLTVSFDGFKALNGLTLYVDPGELRCIIGPNGAGKTTMMDVITGKTRPAAGSAWFGRKIDLLALSEPEIA